MDPAATLKALVAVDSTSTRSNGPIIDLLEKEVKAIGFETRRMKWKDASGVDKFNLVCRRGPDQPGGLALVGHTDCVPFDADWKEALAGIEKDGRIYGRGAADTKGYLAAALAAASRTQAGAHPPGGHHGSTASGAALV